MQEAGSGQVAAAFERPAQGDFIGELKTGPGWQAMRDPGDSQAFPGKALGEVLTGGVAFNIAAEGNDDLADLLALEARFQVRDAEILGLDAVDR